MDFLNQLLPEKHQITQLTYGKTEALSDAAAERKAVFDIYCTNQNGERFIVEVQKAKFNYFKERSIFYSTYPIREQVEKGEWDFALEAIYTVGILDFVFEETKEEDQVLTRVQLKDQQCRVFYEKLTYLYIELPKFKKPLEALENRFEQWLYLLKNLDQLQGRPSALQDRIFEKFFEAAEIARYTPTEREAYQQSLKHLRDWYAAEKTAWQEGLEQGLEEGLEKGKLQGLEEGVKKEKRETAMRLLKAGIDMEIVKNASGLGIEELLLLKEELNK